MIGIIEAIDVAGQPTGQELLIASAEINMLRGAIVGALIAALAFLAGFAVLRRGALTYSAAFMVGTATALELFWLGFFQAPNFNLIVLLQGVFAASVIIFLSASVRIARNNAALGGIMFAASLVFIGVGIINFLGRADFAATMVRGLAAVGIFAFGLSLVQSLRGDHGARLILPGTMLTMAAVVIFATSGAGGLLGHGLFSLGILAASLIALTDKSATSAQQMPIADIQAFDGAQVQPGTNKTDAALSFSSGASQLSAGQKACDISASKAGRKPPISSERLLEVLDFSGIGVWDWSLDGVYQSRSLCSMLGSDCEADFTPEAMRAFINPSHLAVFEEEVLGHGTGDGGFDALIRIHNGRLMRLRGARAIDDNGRLERVVSFFEPAQDGDEAALKTYGAQSAAKVPDLHDHDEVQVRAPVVLPISSSRKDINAHLQSEGLSVTSTPEELPRSHSNTLIKFSPVMAFVSKEIIGYRVKAPGGEIKLIRLLDDIIAKSTAFLAEEQEQVRQSSAIKRVSSDAYIALKADWNDLNTAGFLESLQSAIQKHGLQYGALVLELNNLSSIRDPRGAKALFSQLRQAGARIAFADSDVDSAVLGNLHRYDFDYIRIDETLVDSLNGGDSNNKNIRTLMTLGRDLGLRVVASGIETEKCFFSK